LASRAVAFEARAQARACATRTHGGRRKVSNSGEVRRMPLAFLTGGGSTIGEGIACCLAAHRFTVLGSRIQAAPAPQVAAKAGGAAEALELDATDRAHIDATVKDIIARHGQIDALVKIAGGMRGLGIAKSDFAQMTPAIWNRILEVNLQSVLHCCHAVL